MTESPGGPAQDDEEHPVDPRFQRMVEAFWPQITQGRLEQDATSDFPATTPDAGPSDAAPPEAAVSPVTIGRFVIECELGRGGGGIVVRAFDPSLRRSVAMKVPGPEGVLSAPSRRRFLAEARAAAALRHPNIVTVHEAGEAGPIPYLIMDYCEAGSLADWLAARPQGRSVSPRWAARLVARIADGVQHAHDRGILHCDLKPSNILFHAARPVATAAPATRVADPGEEPDLNPLVSDFGLAKSLDETRDGLEQTAHGLPLGTIPYMAREAARGDGATIGFATDVYGLGVILFELLTGRRPFEGRTRDELLDQVLHAEAPSARALRGDVPAPLEAICRKCLQKEPAARYPTPAELARALRGFLETGELVGPEATGKPSARVEPSVPPPQGPRRHLAALVVLAIASLLAVGGASAALWWSAARRPRATESLFQELETAEVATLPALVSRFDPLDPASAARLARLYSTGTKRQKLAAALVLAGTGSQYSSHCYDEILRADPAAIAPLARALQSRGFDLASPLARELDAPIGPGSATEDQNRRRARAACALIALGRDNLGWSLLAFAPDPEARSFLIHWLGPAGIGPQPIVDRLAHEGDDSIRRGLIQALGEVSEASWPAGVRTRARERVLDLFEHDPDAGVHGSSKWLLLRWGQNDELRAREDRLARSPAPAGQRWRVSPLGLTLVRVREPKTGRVIEVADTETTIALFQKFLRDHTCGERVGPEPAQPVTCLTYVLAARFCDWLSDQEGLASSAPAYQPGRALPLEPAPNPRTRTGYRLLTTQEYECACRAGTSTQRYFGTSDTLLGFYAWYGQPYELRMRPVALLKPNDFGLFDMLGNADELCQGSTTPAGSTEQAAVCGGSVLYNAASIRSNQRRGPISVTRDDPVTTAFGFRVARTIGAVE